MKKIIILIKERNLALIEEELTFLELSYNVTLCKDVNRFIEIIDNIDYQMLILDLAFEIDDLAALCTPLILKWKYNRIPIIFISRRQDFRKLYKLPLRENMRCYSIPFSSGELFHKTIIDNMIIHSIMNFEWINKDFVRLPANENEKDSYNLKEDSENSQRIIRLLTENKKLTNELGFHQVDFEMIKNIQSQFMPQKDKCFLDCKFSRFIMPSKYLTGDFVDYFQLDRKFCAFYFADVAGHGLKAGIISIFFKSFLNRFKTESNLDFNPAKVVTKMNKELLDLKIGVHITIFAGLIDTNNNVLTYCNAGQYPLPIIKNRNNVTFIKKNNLPIGIIESPNYNNENILFKKGDTILIVSDGILEILMDKTLEEKKNILLNSISNDRVSIEQINNHFGVMTTKEIPDDITSLLIKRLL